MLVITPTSWAPDSEYRINRVARLMREHGIKAKMKRKYRNTTDSNHQMPVAENILNRNFYADKPNQKWVSDIRVPQQAA